MTTELKPSTVPPASPRPPRLWWAAILTYGPLCWVLLGLVEVLDMEAWRIANTAFQVAPPTVRAAQFLLLLPVLLLACRAAVWVGSTAVPIRSEDVV